MSATRTTMPHSIPVTFSFTVGGDLFWIDELPRLYRWFNSAAIMAAISSSNIQFSFSCPAKHLLISESSSLSVKLLSDESIRDSELKIFMPPSSRLVRLLALLLLLVVELHSGLWSSSANKELWDDDNSSSSCQSGSGIGGIVQRCCLCRLLVAKAYLLVCFRICGAQNQSRGVSESIFSLLLHNDRMEDKRVVVRTVRSSCEEVRVRQPNAKWWKKFCFWRICFQRFVANALTALEFNLIGQIASHLFGCDINLHNTTRPRALEFVVTPGKNNSPPPPSHPQIFHVQTDLATTRDRAVCWQPRLLEYYGNQQWWIATVSTFRRHHYPLPWMYVNFSNFHQDYVVLETKSPATNSEEVHLMLVAPAMQVPTSSSMSAGKKGQPSQQWQLTGTFRILPLPALKILLLLIHMQISSLVRAIQFH